MAKRRCLRVSASVASEEDDFAILEKLGAEPLCGSDDSSDFSLVSESLLPGPQTVEEVFRWPHAVLNSIESRPGCREGMQRLMSQGMLSTTDYSGIDCPREVCYQVITAMCRLWQFDTTTKFLRSCDNAPLPQKVLLWLSTHLDNKESCVVDEPESC